MIIAGGVASQKTDLGLADEHSAQLEVDNQEMEVVSCRLRGA